jgi:Na+-translocating ferredoxin:NAD+ oxidoreductase RNF subunit RnfB
MRKWKLDQLMAIHVGESLNSLNAHLPQFACHKCGWNGSDPIWHRWDQKDLAFCPACVGQLELTQVHAGY